MITQAFKAGADSYQSQRALVHDRIYELHLEGFSPVEISEQILSSEQHTGRCSADCVRENLKYRFGITKYNKRKIKKKHRDAKGEATALKKEERRNSLGPSNSWDRTIMILALTLQDNTQGNVRKKLKIFRQSASWIVMKAIKAGFEISKYAHTTVPTGRNSLLRSVYLLYTGQKINDVAEELYVKVEHLHTIERLMRKHGISSMQQEETVENAS